MSIVTGTVSSTVVTLSRNAENTAVTIDIISRMPHGRASTFFAAQIATYWNNPERRVMLTISIMPSSRPSVFQSTAPIASCCGRDADRISEPGADERDDRPVHLLAHDDRVYADEQQRRHPQRGQAEDHGGFVPRRTVHYRSPSGCSAARTSRAVTMPTSSPVRSTTTGIALHPL